MGRARSSRTSLAGSPPHAHGLTRRQPTCSHRRPMGRMLKSPLVVLRRAIAFFKRRQLDAQIAQEIRQHLELRTRALIEEGMDSRAAALEARRRFGNITLIREDAREMWNFRALATILQDVRYGARMMRRSPEFSAVSSASLATGVAATV